MNSFFFKFVFGFVIDSFAKNFSIARKKRFCIATIHHDYQRGCLKNFFDPLKTKSTFNDKKWIKSGLIHLLKLTTMTAFKVLPAVIFSFHILWSNWSKIRFRSNSISFVVTDRFRKIFWNDDVSAIACLRFSFKKSDADAPACPSAIANKQQLRKISSTITTSSCFWRHPWIQFLHNEGFTDSERMSS